MASRMPKVIGPVTRLATAEGRDYITPEDVGDAMRAARVGHGDLPAKLAEIRHEVLAVLGREDGWGAEDSSLCAFVAAVKTEEADRG